MFGYCPLSSIWLSKEADVVLLLGKLIPVHLLWLCTGFFPIRTRILFVMSLDLRYWILGSRLEVDLCKADWLRLRMQPSLQLCSPYS